MLSRRTLRADASANESVDLRFAGHNALFFKVFYGDTVSRLICKRADSTRSEGMSLTEQNFGEFMCVCLNVTREIEVDVRYFVPLEAEEGFKRNVVSVSYHLASAFGTIFRRKVKTASDRAVFNEFGVFALRASVMGRK